MDDRLLSSLCGDPTSYCTFKTQEDARDQSKAPHSRVSQDGHTYIHMVVPIDSHWVAVKVTISPFALKQHPNQTFFSSQLRCGPCCTNIDNLYMLQYVTDTVQKVVNSNYRPVYWKYRASQCIFDPPSNSSADHCTSVTKSRLQSYATLGFARSTSLTESLATRNGGGDANLGQPPVADRTTTTENYLPGHLTDIPHLPARAVAQSDVGSAADGTEYSVSLNSKLKRKRGRYKQNEVTSSDGGQVKAPRDLKAKTDAQLVQDTLATLKRGLAEVPACNAVASLTLDQLVGKSAFQIGCDVWDHAISLDRSSKTLVWAYKYIAACCWLVGSEFASPAETVPEAPHRSRTTIHHWRCAAEVINLIVNAMLPIWGESAYSIFNVFADEGLQMADVGRLAKKRREEFVKGIVDGLKELGPPRSGGTLLFNPICTIMDISNHSAEEINYAIKLSNANLHGDEWPLQVRGMPELGSCVGRLMAPIISTVTASAARVEGLPERRTDRSMDPELIPLTELSSDPQSDTLGTLATVAISQITPSSIEVTIPCMNPKDRFVFAGHETTTDQEQLFPKNLFQAPSSPSVSNEDVTYMEELPLFNAENISFQSFN